MSCFVGHSVQKETVMEIACSILLKIQHVDNCNFHNCTLIQMIEICKKLVNK